MAHNYCTLFGANFMAVGLSLYDSIAQHDPGSTLYILCMDQDSEDILKRKKLPNVVIVSLNDLYPEIINKVRNHVNFGQLCWLSQPLICKYILEKYNVENVTYMDADCYFYSSPEPLFDEIKRNQAAVTVVRHNFIKKWEYLESSAGKYCVQFNYFDRSEEAQKVLNHWTEHCLKYNKEAPSHYVGQISVSQWPEISPRVHVIENPMAGVAPWNAFNFTPQDFRDQKLIFYHFHGLTRITDNEYDIGSIFKVPKWMVKLVYEPYLENLSKNLKMLSSMRPDLVFMKTIPQPSSFFDLWSKRSVKALKSFVKSCYRRWRKEIITT